MKKILLLIFILLTTKVLFSQSNKPIFDNGYYYGVVNDSIKNKHIFIKFLSNDNDSLLFIIPYITNESIDVSFLHKKYSDYYNNMKDNIDGYLLLDNEWNVSGFDNYSYFTLYNDIISFTLNIARFEDSKIDVFYFNGKIIDDGNKIISTISSTNKIFNKSTLILKYIEE